MNKLEKEYGPRFDTFGTPVVYQEYLFEDLKEGTGKILKELVNKSFDSHRDGNIILINESKNLLQSCGAVILNAYQIKKKYLLIGRDGSPLYIIFNGLADILRRNEFAKKNEDIDLKNLYDASCLYIDLIDPKICTKDSYRELNYLRKVYEERDRKGLPTVLGFMCTKKDFMKIEKSLFNYFNENFKIVLPK